MCPLGCTASLVHLTMPTAQQQRCRCGGHHSRHYHTLLSSPLLLILHAETALGNTSSSCTVVSAVNNLGDGHTFCGQQDGLAAWMQNLGATFGTTYAVCVCVYMFCMCPSFCPTHAPTVCLTLPQQRIGLHQGYCCTAAATVAAAPSMPHKPVSHAQ